MLSTRALRPERGHGDSMNDPIQIAYNGLRLTPVEELQLARTIERLKATYVSLYRTSEGLAAFIVDRAGGRHLRIRVTVSSADPNPPSSTPQGLPRRRAAARRGPRCRR